MKLKIEKIVNKLNDNQKKSVFCKSNLLVVAGAGSGKTTVVTIKVANDVINNNIIAKKILCITFTNKASKEMKERISNLIPNGKDVNVYTFHSWCVNFLRVYAELIDRTKSFIIVDDDDVKKLIKFFCSDENAESKVGFHDLEYEEVATKIKNAKESLTDFDMNEDDIKDFSEAERYVLFAYESKLKYMNAVDFTDMIRYATAIMKNNDHLIPVYEKVFIDEFQDTNDAQFKMSELLGMKAKAITAVGDDDQSIYEWRGAKPSNMQLFINKFLATRIDLEENYRSNNNIVNAANALIANNNNRLGKVMIPVKKSDNMISVIKTINQDTESDLIASMINDYLYKNPSNSIGILYRNNRYSRKIEMALRKNSINYKLTKGLEFTKRREIALGFRFLRLASNPRDIVSLDYVLSHFLAGVGPKSIAKINVAIEKLDEASIYSGKGIPLKGEQLSKFIMIMNLAKRISDLPLKDVGFALGTYFIPTDDTFIVPFFDLGLFSSDKDITIEKIDYKNRNDICRVRLKDKFCKFKGDKPEQLDDRIDNFDELICWLDEFSLKRKNATLSDFLQESSIDASDKESDESAMVNLMTVHSSKGLEFDRVYIIGCINGFFPGLRDGESKCLEEPRRLMYVAITRAKDDLIITTPEENNPRFSHHQQSPSLFLREFKDFSNNTDHGKKAKLMKMMMENY